MAKSKDRIENVECTCDKVAKTWDVWFDLVCGGRRWNATTPAGDKGWKTKAAARRYIRALAKRMNLELVEKAKD